MCTSWSGRRTTKVGADDIKTNEENSDQKEMHGIADAKTLLKLWRQGLAR